MRRSRLGRTTLGSVLALILGAVPAAAQVRGIPVNNSGVPTGLAVYGDVGFSNSDAGKGTAFGASGRLGVGPFGITGTLDRFNPSGPADNITSVGGTLNYQVFGGPLVPLTATLQGGLGYDKVSDVKFYHVPIGLGIALTIPNPVLAIKPWLAPRVDIVHVTPPATVNVVGSGGSAALSSDTETHFGISGGVEFNLLNGIGLQASYDRVFVDGGDPGVFAAGLHYAFRIPGL
ncbi:MAG TPA: outer membrane beta-barrel protein [Gemmatimonadales bacterium]|nr:outer membrane beta-barrel protein [Gemmatimonadales bacterium]